MQKVRSFDFLRRMRARACQANLKTHTQDIWSRFFHMSAQTGFAKSCEDFLTNGRYMCI